MIQISDDERRRAFSTWLRSGRLPSVRTAEVIELKFNPWHDPRNGRFTFAPGGSRGSTSKYARSTGNGLAGRGGGKNDRVPSSEAPSKADQVRPPTRPGPIFGRGGNSQAFQDPMTLEQAVPALRTSPARSILAIADNIFDITGPGNRAAVGILQDRSEQIIRDIKAIDPSWHYEGLGPVETVDGNINKVNELRFTRASVLLRVRQEVGSLQVETLRFIQDRTDKAYDRGMALLRAGRLKVRLSNQEALGNFIDQRVRTELRERYNQAGIDSAGKGPVRVNRREDDNSGADLTYRRPDARVGNVAYDVTLTRKTLQTPQVRGFFNADFQPSSVVIIRPRQLGGEASYVILRPETKR